jgi:hypothetical protein
VIDLPKSWDFIVPQDLGSSLILTDLLFECIPCSARHHRANVLGLVKGFVWPVYVLHEMGFAGWFLISAQFLTKRIEKVKIERKRESHGLDLSRSISGLYASGIIEPNLNLEKLPNIYIYISINNRKEKKKKKKKKKKKPKKPKKKS